VHVGVEEQSRRRELKLDLARVDACVDVTRPISLLTLPARRGAEGGSVEKVKIEQLGVVAAAQSATPRSGR
jgi:hypothetical protein